MTLLRKPVTLVWLGLMAATCITTWVLTENVVAAVVGTIGIFLISAVKIGFVMSEFMELRTAPPPWQVGFSAWIVVVTAMILAFYLATR